MTLDDLLTFSSLVSDWCHAQNDLAEYRFDPYEGGARVQILWRDGRHSDRQFTASEVRTMRRDDVVTALGTMTIPGWLPG